jgi:hypothetical protein
MMYLKQLKKNTNQILASFMGIGLLFLSLESHSQTCAKVGEKPNLRAGKFCCEGLENMRVPDELMGEPGVCGKVACVSESSAHWNVKGPKYKVLFSDNPNHYSIQIIKINNDKTENVVIQDFNHSAILVQDKNTCVSSLKEKGENFEIAYFQGKTWLSRSFTYSVETHSFECNDEGFSNLVFDDCYKKSQQGSVVPNNSGSSRQ